MERNFLRDITSVRHKGRTSFSEQSLTKIIQQFLGYQEKFCFNTGDTRFCSSILPHKGSLSIGVSLNVVLFDWMITILLLGNNAGGPSNS
ncbi:nitrilase-like protein 1 [Prunus dulcis]|uniref:Nitrilase-like protein 1 n=1 Tax=Prunus dulcis TaxID=3755 RepID=A0A4Y1RTB6_PRUDU|nr:nitrilase-like protein 1 [Prunus dulcis]